MITVLSKLHAVGYRHVIKPLLFRIAPDTVHETITKIGAGIQRAACVRVFLRSVLAYKNETVLSQTIHGIHFANPIGLSAGFDKNFKLVYLMQSLGFGYMEGGSVTYRACPGNPRPWFYRLPDLKSLVVHAGLNNDGVVPVLGRLEKYSQEQLIDFPLNISCPNTFGGEPFTSPHALDRLLKEVDHLGLRQPVFIKMPIDLAWEDFEALLEVIVRHEINGVTIGNLRKNRSGLSLSAHIPEGGLSGKSTVEMGNALIRKTYNYYGNLLTIIGVGGVFTAEDAYTKIKLGASLVEMITGMIFEGPQVIGQINKDLAALVAADGYTSIAQAIGVEARQEAVF